MISVIDGPLIVRAEMWTLVFNREAKTRWASWLAMGRYKHVRAYAYVPFLHVWVFFDPHIGGTDMFFAADGEPAQRMIGSWIVNADLIRLRRQPGKNGPPVLGFCVQAIKRLMGLQCLAMRPDALYRHCITLGGEPFEAVDGCPAISSPGT